ncbi:hypothetical protein HYX70_02820 [Candidatus Saccharibacteria bacterium]|nr:hypothetical protein [Candidatus Saccharibacteria bacterium]
MADQKPVIEKIKLNPFKLLVQSWQRYRKDFVRLWLTAVVASVPASILRLTGQSGTVDLSYIGSMAGIFMLIALLLVVLERETNARQSLVALYNQASGSFLRYLGLSIIEAVIAVPLIVSFVLLVLALGVQFSFWPAIVVAAAVGLGFFAYIFTRFSLSPYFLLDSNITVWRSLRSSWRMTKKRFWKILGGYVVILLIVITISSGTVQLLNMVPLFRQNDFVNAIISGLLASLLLPFLLVYVGKIYDRVAAR